MTTRIHAATDAKCALFTLEGVEIPIAHDGNTAEDREDDVYLVSLEHDKQYYWIERDGNAWELHEISSTPKEGMAMKNIIFCFTRGKELSPWRKMRIEELKVPDTIRAALGV